METPVLRNDRQVREVLPRRTESFVCPSGRTCEITHWASRSPGFPSVFAFSLHKAGSTLFNQVLADLGRAAGIGVVCIPTQLFRQGILDDDFPHLPAEFFQRTGYIYCGYRAFPQGFEIPEELIENSGLLVRDPRDMLVSMYYSFTGRHAMAQTDPESCRRIEEIRRREREYGLGRYVLRNAGTVEAEFQSYRASLSRLKVWRYEDVVFDKTRWVRDIAAHFQIELPTEQLDQIATKHDVRPQAESPHSHIRRVTPGDAREKLSPRTFAFLNRRFRSTLQRHAYPTDSPPVEACEDRFGVSNRDKTSTRTLTHAHDGLRVDPATLASWTYSQVSQLQALRHRFATARNFELINHGCSPLECHRNLLALAFLEDNIPPGGRILHVGPLSRAMRAAFGRHHELEVIDRDSDGDFGTVPTSTTAASTTIVRLIDQLSIPTWDRSFDGVFSLSTLPTLPGRVPHRDVNGYFDHVFSVPAVSHVSPEVDLVRQLIERLDSVTRPGGLNLHVVSLPLEPARPEDIPCLHYPLFERAAYGLPAPQVMLRDVELLALPQESDDPALREKAVRIVVNSCAFWPSRDSC
jgi:hypothetical protein